MRKSALCICKSKSADKLRGNRAVHWHLSFRYKERSISLPPKSEMLSLWPFSVVGQAGLYLTWSEATMTGFLIRRIKCCLRQCLRKNTPSENLDPCLFYV